MDIGYGHRYLSFFAGLESPAAAKTMRFMASGVSSYALGHWPSTGTTRLLYILLSSARPVFRQISMDVKFCDYVDISVCRQRQDSLFGAYGGKRRGQSESRVVQRWPDGPMAALSL